MTKEELIAFETEVAESFTAGKIKAPVHLSGGNEDQLIEIFKQVKPDDWCFSTHRSHYHALLKGIPPDWVMKEILEGRSINLFNKEHKFFTSAIVGGCLPIAVGTAMGIKRKGGKERVWVFVGDMAATMGIYHECGRYAFGHSLPITFVTEDNGLSVNTSTEDVWGRTSRSFGSDLKIYSYHRTYPHLGTGQWVVISRTTMNLK